MIALTTDSFAWDAMGRLGARVVPEASYAVDDQRRGLWIVADLWKTQRPRFPHVLGRRTDRAAHNAPQAVSVSVFRMTDEERTISAPSDARRKEIETAIPSSLRSDE